MKRLLARLSVLAVVAAAGVWLASPAQADPPAAGSTSTSVACGSFNNMDGGTVAGTEVTCGSGFRAVLLETEADTTTPAYICGGTGCTKANYATVGLKRCVGCNNGSQFSLDGLQGTVRCVSGVADASVTFAVHCAR